MQFEIRSRPTQHRQACGLARSALLGIPAKKSATLAPAGFRIAGKSRSCASRSTISGVDAAATIAIADSEQRSGIVLDLAAEIAPGRHISLGPHFAIIAVDRVVECMGQHPAAVETFPPEQVGGNVVGLAPVDLDGEEIVDAALLQKLWQRAGEAEAIGQPADGVADAKGLFEIALAVEDLPRKAFAGRHVGIGLDPHAADGLPLARRDARPLMALSSAGSSSSICA